MTSCKGFTLIELLVTIAISAILLSIAIPSFESEIAQTNAKEVAQSIKTGLDWSKSFAISSTKMVTYQANSGCSWQSGYSGALVANSGSAVMPSYVQCSVSNAGSVYFLPDGSVTQAVSGQPALTQPITYTVTGGGNTWVVSLATSGDVTETLQ